MPSHELEISRILPRQFWFFVSKLPPLTFRKGSQLFYCSNFRLSDISFGKTLKTISPLPVPDDLVNPTTVSMKSYVMIVPAVLIEFFFNLPIYI